MTPEELALIQRAKTDSLAFTQLFDQYLPLVIKTVNAYFIRDYTYEDWLQEARIAMLNAVRRFDGSSGSRFGSFFRMVLLSHINSLLRKHLAQKRQVDATVLVVPDPVPVTASDDGTAARIEDNLLIRTHLRQFVDTLSDHERQGLVALIDPSAGYLDHRAIERTKGKFSVFLREQLE